MSLVTAVRQVECFLGLPVLSQAVEFALDLLPEEFVAHTSNVTCARIARKSSGIVVTGGSDHKVNLWSLGNPVPVLCLAGHTSGVECLTLDPKEEDVLIAGAATGSIKLWDLQEAKVVRTVSGHKVTCMSLDFHPFGDFFASGSLDTSLKVWDIRRKDCIHTYKGHAGGVKCLKFSPDGRWVVSGGEDGVVKLWDLTAGKLMHDFKFHEGQVLCLDFHPHEFLLASGSSDGTNLFYDLETFELIGSAGPETRAVQGVAFTPDGRTLLSASYGTIKVWGWEPVQSFDKVAVPWAHQNGDMTIQDGRLVGCSLIHSNVGLWAMELAKVAPFAPEEPSLPVSPRLPAAIPNPQQQRGETTPPKPGRDAVTTSSDGTKFVKQQTTPLDGLKPRSRTVDRQTYSSTVETTSAPPSPCRRPMCLKANLLHHSGNCEMALVEVGPPSQPLTNSNSRTTTGPKANFTTTTISSRQKTAHSRVNANHDSTQRGPGKNSRARRASVGTAELGNIVQESVTEVQESNYAPADKRGSRTNRRASLSPFANNTSSLTHASTLESPVAYIMAMESPPPPSPAAPAPMAPFSLSARFDEHKNSVIVSPVSKTGLPEARPEEVDDSENVARNQVRKESRIVSEGTSTATIPAVASAKPFMVLPSPLRVESEAETGAQRIGGSDGMARAAEDEKRDTKAPDRPGVPRQSEGLPRAGEARHKGEAGQVHSKPTDRPMASLPSSSRAASGVSHAGPSIEPSPSSLRVSGMKGSGASVSGADGGEASRHGRRQEGNGAAGLENGYDHKEQPGRRASSEVVMGRRTELPSAQIRSDEGPEPPQSPLSQIARPKTPTRLVVPEVSTEGRGEAANGALPQGTPPRRAGRGSSSTGAKPLGLNVAAFLPKGGPGVAEESALEEVKDEEMIVEMMEQHHTMEAILQARLTNVQVVKTFWVKDDVKGAVEAMERMADSSVVVDVLSMLATRSGVFTLEICSLLLPLLEDLLSSPHDRYVSTGLSVLAELLKNFGDIIRSTRASKPAPGVDIQAEQRRERCHACYLGFLALGDHLSALVRKGGMSGKDARELYSSIQRL